MPFSLGNIPHNKGKHLSPEHRKKIGDSQKGKIISDHMREQLRIVNTGKHMSEEIRMKVSISKKGTPAWNKGKKTPLVTRALLRESHLRNPNRYWLGKRREGTGERLSNLRHSLPYHLKRSDIWYGAVKHHDDTQYCDKFNRPFKERVRAYRGYVCFLCGTPQNGKKLSIHHLHYDKKMCCNGSPKDVVPLCARCHAKTNHNKDYWEKYLTELLYSYDPSGKCFFTQDEMKSFLGESL